jgi:hypothetical protein
MHIIRSSPSSWDKQWVSNNASNRSHDTNDRRVSFLAATPSALPSLRPALWCHCVTRSSGPHTLDFLMAVGLRKANHSHLLVALVHEEPALGVLQREIT